MARKIVSVAMIVLLAASASYAESLFEVLSSAVKATATGVKKLVTESDPGKVVSDTAEGTVEGTQKMGEAAVGGTENIVGTVGKAVGNK
jgi:Skp family chaperone for outer membrane proteins